MKEFKLRPYQANALMEISKIFNEGNQEAVLSICPSGGKTFTALKFAAMSNYKTLVLAHGTEVLRSQWLERAQEYGIKASTSLNSQISINLPHSLYNKKLPQVDLLIVDEAHEFYFAGKNNETKSMMDKIIAKVRPKKILLLTGTPSKFILYKKKVVFVTADQLLQEGYLNEVYFGIATTTENIKDSEYNKNGDLSFKRKFKKTKDTLDDLMASIHKRLKASRWKTQVKAHMSTAHYFDVLHKTMIACNGIEQANEVGKYFTDKGIKTVVSHYGNDIKSLNVQEFIDDESIRILVVVNRGILGFDLPELVNVVDMTCSRNIDRIYQLYARVMRKHPDHDCKFFFKVVPEAEEKIQKFYMHAALCMIMHKFISRFNGKNLKNIEIPALKASRSRKPSSGKSKSKPKPQVNFTVDAEFLEEVEATRLLRDIYTKADKKYSEYAYTTLGYIKSKLEGKTRPIVRVTEEDLLYILRTGKVPESIYV